MTSSRTVTDTDSASIVEKKYITYKARWLVLITCCLLALSNSMQWLVYNAVPDETNSFYCENSGTKCDAAVVSNQVFQITAVITGLGGMYVTDHVGIRFSILCGVFFNAIGSSMRLISSLPIISEPLTRQIILYSGTGILSCAQAFFLVLPSKIAECWFAEDQRALANVLTFIANPAGVVVGTLIPEIFVHKDDQETKDSWKFFGINLVMTIVAVITTIMALFIRRSNPPTAPSAANEYHSKQAPAFFTAIWRCLKNVQFLLQNQTFALGFALLFGVFTVMPDILNARGYEISGIQIAVAAFVGIFASLVAGWVADRTKWFKQILLACSIVFGLGAIFCRFYLEKGHNSNDTLATLDVIVILGVGGLLGAASLPQFPIGIEMGVETTFPVYEATSSGLMVLSGNLWMFALETLFSHLKDSSFIYEKDNDMNWRLCLDVWCILAIVNVIIILFLKPRYNRVALDKQTEKEDSSASTKDSTVEFEAK